MTRRAAPSWQVVLSDLALILFLTTLAASGGGDGGRVGEPDEKPVAPSPRAAELAVYRENAGGLSLARWLAEEGRDGRAQLTVTGRYRSGEYARVSAAAQRMAGEAARHGHEPRLVLEPGAQNEVLASFSYDAPQAASQAQTTRLRPASLAR